MRISQHATVPSDRLLYHVGQKRIINFYCSITVRNSSYLGIVANLSTSCCSSSSNSRSSSASSTHSIRSQHRSCCRTSMYDNPALYSNDDAFSERVYWDKRYQQDPTTFEWYRSYSSLQPILTKHLPKPQHILQLGVGSSRIQEDMADDGYSHITSIDYSPIAIQRLQQAYAARPELDYAVADARFMPQYPDAGFGGVLDKGTLDALLCGDDDVTDAGALMREVWRLLAPGGAYVMITSASPRTRLRYLQQETTPWQAVLVYEVGQQGAMTGPFLCSCATANGGEGGTSSGSNATGTSGGSASGTVAAGISSFDSTTCQGVQLDKALQLPQMGYSHLVYVCYK